MSNINAEMRTGEKGLDLIKSFEGLRLETYLCSAGVPTIGYGTTRINNKPIELGMKITKEEAESFLKSDLSKFESAIIKSVKVKLNQNQFDALVCFVYNIGIGNFNASTLLKLLNQGKIKESSEQFIRWNKVKGKVVNGLTRRREAEKKLFNEV